MAFGKEGVRRCAGRCARVPIRTVGRTRQARTTEKRRAHRRTPQNGGWLKGESRGAPHPLSTSERAKLLELGEPPRKRQIERAKRRCKTMKNAILIDKIKEMDETEVIILRYLIRVLQNSADGGKRISYARSAKFLGMTYPCFTKAVKRLKEKQILVQSGEKLYLGKMIVEAVAAK